MTREGTHGKALCEEAAPQTKGNSAGRRRRAIGAEAIDNERTSFRVWAPKARELEVVIEDPPGDREPRCYQLKPERDGYFSGVAPARAGAYYRFRLNGHEQSHPDPASRSQPLGVHGPSCIVDPEKFEWTDRDWRGTRLHGRVVYEMHIGTFTPEGSWSAAARELPELARIGFDVVEMMPITEFPGEFGWGYDGVDLFAPYHRYGTPDDLRGFVDQAHRCGLAVILDVVYNHLGPEGNYLRIFSEDYFSDRYETEWGDPLNFDDKHSQQVREFFIENACYWIDEFHFDGFRFDATQSIFDKSSEHILCAISKAVRQMAAERELILLAENEPQDTRLVRPCEAGGYGLDGLWNDDFHHSARVALTGFREAYYTDYRGTPQELISAAKYGYLFQGQHYLWQKKRRGTPGLHLPPEALVAFIENHDQVANTPDGRRLRQRTSPGKYRAVTALLLLGPWTPMLFQGQEFGATARFTYFVDLQDSLREPVGKGRAEFLSQFPSYATREMQKQFPVPWDRETFRRCQLDLGERETHAEIYRLHRDLIALRKSDPRFHEQRPRGLDGAVLSSHSFVLRFFDDSPESDDRLLVVNLGNATEFTPAPEPLLAPPLKRRWETLWSSDSETYGGPGLQPVECDGAWRLPAEAAVVLRSERRTPA